MSVLAMDRWFRSVHERSLHPEETASGERQMRVTKDSQLLKKSGF